MRKKIVLKNKVECDGLISPHIVFMYLYSTPYTCMSIYIDKIRRSKLHLVDLYVYIDG